MNVREAIHKIINTQLSFLQQCGRESPLALIQSVLVTDHVGEDYQLTAMPYLRHLNGEPVDEVLDPASEIHIGRAHALQRHVERGAVAIIELAQRE